MTTEPVLIKTGGSSLKTREEVTSICQAIANLQSHGVPVVIVHGGGPSINEELTRRGIQWEFHEGQRVTTPEMMEVIEMVLSGKINSLLVRTLNQCGMRAVGISGTDGSLLSCIRAGGKLGQVGIVETVNTEVLSALSKAQATPVIATLGVDSEGEALNINADWAASKIAQAMQVKKLIYLTDQDGILNSEGTLISRLDAEQLEGLIQQGVVKGGMLTKAKTVLEALQNKISEVIIMNAKDAGDLINVVQGTSATGTLCRQLNTPFLATAFPGLRLGSKVAS